MVCYHLDLNLYHLVRVRIKLTRCFADSGDLNFLIFEHVEIDTLNQGSGWNLSKSKHLLAFDRRF